MSFNGYGPEKLTRRDLKQFVNSRNNFFVNKIITGCSGINKERERK